MGNRDDSPTQELLKVLSRFGVSINTLLGSPQTLYWCCDAVVDGAMISREPDGSSTNSYYYK